MMTERAKSNPFFFSFFLIKFLQPNKDTIYQKLSDILSPEKLSDHVENTCISY